MRSLDVLQFSQLKTVCFLSILVCLGPGRAYQLEDYSDHAKICFDDSCQAHPEITNEQFSNTRNGYLDSAGCDKKAYRSSVFRIVDAGSHWYLGMNFRIYLNT